MLRESGRRGIVMRIETAVIPVEGVSRVPAISETIDVAIDDRQQKAELRLLKVATGLAITLVSCAWAAIALD